MHIVLLNDDWIYGFRSVTQSDIGIKQTNSTTSTVGEITEWIFEVIDEKLFLLSVLKYGIDFKEV